MPSGPIPFEFFSALVVGVVVATVFGGIALPADPLHLALFLVSAVLATLIKFGHRLLRLDDGLLDDRHVRHHRRARSRSRTSSPAP